MGVPAAPRIDDRLRRDVAGAGLFDSPAEVTRAVGALAWELGLPRPSYQQVRFLMRGSRRPEPAPAGVQTSRGALVLQAVDAALGWLIDYPGVGLGPIYREALRGRS
jgi:hypothetical protein